MKSLITGRNNLYRSIKYITNIYNSNYVYIHNATIPSFTSSRSTSNSYRFCTSSQSQFPENPEGKYNNTKGECDSMIKKREQMFAGPKRIIKGDVINLHDLLFTENRDYLVRYNDDRQVNAAELEDKIIVLYFVPVEDDYFEMEMSHLIETYNYLLPHNVFEVVFVAYDEEEKTAEDILSSDSVAKFEDKFSRMPWTAIPFSDITSRERLASRFGIRTRGDGPFVIDSTGMVLQRHSSHLFEKYGGLGYPFSDGRIEFLKSQDDATAKKPSLKALLASPERDYLISNNGDKVLIDTLKEKVVALYFYEEGVTPGCLTEKIKAAYEEFAQNKHCFEVVLIYLYDTYETFNRTSEESFYNLFTTMPWLALPFKDPACRKLKRLVGYPEDSKYGIETPPTLVIVGPHGEFVEPWGASIIDMFKLSAYPFNREIVAKLDTEKVRELKLEMLWDRNTLFKRKDGIKVQFSQLIGKRIILFFEGTKEDSHYRKEAVVKFLNLLEQSYIYMYGTKDEFEVIHITSSNKEKSVYDEHIGYMTWFVSSSELLPIDLSLYNCYCHHYSGPPFNICCRDKWQPQSSILAFDRDGRVVRKSQRLSFDNFDFPFYAGGMEKEAFFELNNFFRWYEMDIYHGGMLINSYYSNEGLPRKVGLEHELLPVIYQ